MLIGTKSYGANDAAGSVSASNAGATDSEVEPGVAGGIARVPTSGPSSTGQGSRTFGLDIDPDYCDVVVRRWETAANSVGVRWAWKKRRVNC